jgi:hypothetical protein
MKHGALASVVPGLIVFLAIGSLAAQAGDDEHHHRRNLDADLTSYNEVPTLSTRATADMDARINKDETEITYTLEYKGFGTNVAQAHIHLGRRAVNGGVMVFFCSNLGNGPAGTPTCPNNADADGTFSGTVSGTWTAASVIGGAAAAGVPAGALADVIAAIRAGATYANIHTTRFPAGEIRDQVKAFGF